MKVLYILILNLIVLEASAYAPTMLEQVTEPQQIAPITRAIYPKDYYDTQATLWKTKIDSDQLNPNAWLNYYLACRTINMLTPERNPHDLSVILENITTKIPTSYEYHYLTYLHNEGDAALFHHLEKAYDLNSKRTEIYSHMINHYLTIGNEERFRYFCKLWMASGEVPAGILSWNYNALIGLEPAAILLTNGDNDTYPAWLLQQVEEVRPDVTVINVHLLKSRSYRDRLFNTIKIPAYPATEKESEIWQSDLLPVADHIMRHAKRPLYFNVTIPKALRESYEDVLYNVGLAFKYSPARFDNVAQLKENYEQKFLTDYLRMNFVLDENATVVNTMNVSYLPAFITLYKHYVEQEASAKAEEIKKVLLNIGRVNEKEEQILSLISTTRKWKKDTKTYMNIKSLDKGLKEIKPGLWAADTETTNEQYEAFLMDLLKHKEFNLLEICKTTKVDWMSLLPDKFKNITEDEANRTAGGTPDDPKVPVTNITYEAAQAYCDWLTLAYNGYDKKKKHQKVKFRLPTESEWELAARANHKDADYPWGGYYYKNQKGCYLSNFYSSDDAPCTDCKWNSLDIDGGFFPVKADAYFPNDYGLYGMSGNVAEMSEGGHIAKGGSWEDPPSDCKITSQKKINGISPAIGFRVFMEIID